MPKKIDDEVRARAVRLVLEHQSEYASLTAAAEAVARQVGVGKESVRRWVIQAQIDGGQRQGATSEELAEIKTLKAKVRRLEEDNEILRRASIFFAGELDPATADVGVRRHLASRGPRGRVDLSGAAWAGLPDRRADLPVREGHPPAGRGAHGQRRPGP